MRRHANLESGVDNGERLRLVEQAGCPAQPAPLPVAGQGQREAGGRRRKGRRWLQGHVSRVDH